jgi:hypothetical protein
MAFLRTFAALIVAALVWMGLFVVFDDADSDLLNALADWISPLTVSGWFVYAALSLVCYFIAARFIGQNPGPSDPP